MKESSSNYLIIIMFSSSFLSWNSRSWRRKKCYNLWIKNAKIFIFRLILFYLQICDSLSLIVWSLGSQPKGITKKSWLCFETFSFYQNLARNNYWSLEHWKLEETFVFVNSWSIMGSILVGCKCYLVWMKIRLT